jgi:hypothetical protein
LLGITDIEIVALDQLQMLGEDKRKAADAYVATV